MFILTKSVPWVGEYTSTELVRHLKSAHLKSLSEDELWTLHEQIVAELSRKLAAEKAAALLHREIRLRALGVKTKGCYREGTLRVQFFESLVFNG